MMQKYVTVFVFVTVLGLSRGRCSNYKLFLTSQKDPSFVAIDVSSDGTIKCQISLPASKVLLY